LKIQNLFSASLVNGLAACLSYALVIYLARIGADGSYGYFLYNLTWALILSSFLDFAGEAVLAKYAQHNKSIEKAVSVIYSMRLIAFFSIMVIFIFFSPSYAIIDVKIFLLMIPIFYLGPLFEYFNKNLTFVVIQLLEKMVLVTLVYCMLENNGFSDVIYFLYFGANCFSLLIQIYILRKKLTFSVKNLYASIINYILLYYGMFFVLQLHLAYGYFTRLMVEARHGMDAFSSVAIALQLINAASLFQSQVDRTFRMPIFLALSDKCWTSLRSAICRYLVFSTIPILMLCLMLFFGAQIIADSLFSGGYSGLTQAIKFLCITPFSVNLMRLGDALFTGMHLTSINMKITFVAVICLVSVFSFAQEMLVSGYLVSLVIIQLFHGIFSVMYGLRLIRKLNNNSVI
jgi:O-antigen/teichoic acid export membrane protein